MVEMDHQDFPKKLYEASIRGCVSTLNLLIDQDPLILDKISLTSFSETPLHIASLLGHVDFAKTLLHHKPKLTAELDSQGHSSLHLASSEGHTEIVKALLSVNTNTCLVPDQHGRIPLHLAARRGRVEVTSYLTHACPESILVKSHTQETVLHLCVKYNRLEVLKLLVESVSNDGQFLNSTDSDGNTIIHLAVMENQVQTIKYLVSIPEVRVEADALATMFRNNALDLKRMPNIIPSTSTAAPSSHLALENSEQPSSANNLDKYLDYQGKWLEHTRGNLMVAATVMLSMTFQTVINPPGGIWEEEDATKCPIENACIPGTSRLAYYKNYLYHATVRNNTISFSISLATIFLLMFGAPLKHRFSLVILLIVMGVNIFFIMATYVNMISSFSMPNDKSDYTLQSGYAVLWLVFFGLCIAYQAIKTLIWMIRKLSIGVSRAVRHFNVPSGHATEPPAAAV